MPESQHTDTTSMAGALRTLADLLDATPVRELPEVWLTVSLQLVTTTGTRRAERLAAVEALAAHLDLGAPRTGATTVHASRDRGGAYVSAHTSNEGDDGNEYVRRRYGS